MQYFLSYFLVLLSHKLCDIFGVFVVLTEDRAVMSCGLIGVY